VKLKEFDLWAYKLELSDSRAFTLENRCVCAHFERYFDGIDTEGIYRVIIKLSDGDPRDGTTEISSSVLKYYKKFDFNTFNKQGFDARKEMILTTLYSSLLQLCEVNGWPQGPFKIAKTRVIDDEYINIYEVSRKNNPSRNMVASLNAEHTAEQFKLDLVVTDKLGNEIFCKNVLSEEPDEFLFNNQIGRIKWKSKNVVDYIAKDNIVLETIEVNLNAQE